MTHAEPDEDLFPKRVDRRRWICKEPVLARFGDITCNMRCPRIFRRRVRGVIVMLLEFSPFVLFVCGRLLGSLLFSPTLASLLPRLIGFRMGP